MPDASGKLFVRTEALGDASLLRKKETQLKGLILAQNERWRRGLGMQVVRIASAMSGARVSNAKVTNPGVGHSRGKLRVIPSDVTRWHHLVTKGVIPLWDGPSWY